MYIEGEVPMVTNGNCYGGCNNNSGWNNGWEGLIGLLIVGALFGGFGGFGFGGGFGGGFGLGGYEAMQLGRLATTNDIASGFNNSAVLNNLNSIKENQLTMQNFINQGFSGLSSQLIGEFRNVDNAICTLGYQNQQGFNQLGSKIDMCCCDLKTMNLENRYLNEKQTCDIINAINCGNQRLVDIYTNDKIDTLNRKLAVAENALNQCQNNAYLLNQINPQPIPAYPVFQNTSFAYPSGVTFGVNNHNGCCGCNNGF